MRVLFYLDVRTKILADGLLYIRLNLIFLIFPRRHHRKINNGILEEHSCVALHHILLNDSFGINNVGKKIIAPAYHLYYANDER